MTAGRLPATDRRIADRGRRRFLGAGLALATACVAPGAAAHTLRPRGERRLALHNLHTGEDLDAVYWRNGSYREVALRAVNRVLRDHRTGDVHSIDPGLLDLITRLHHELGGDAPYHVISGYRSPATNALLRARSGGVAKRSLHMDGRAIDVRLPGRRLADLRRTAIALRGGGVGYYPASDFVHVDTGRVRTW